MSVRRIPLPLQHLKARRTRVTKRVGPLQTNPRRARPLHPASLRLDGLEQQPLPHGAQGLPGHGPGNPIGSGASQTASASLFL